MQSAALALPPAAVAAAAADHGAAVPSWISAVGALGLGLWGWRRWRPRSVTSTVMARHLDRTWPELEESAELLLAEEANLPLVGRLQRRRLLAAVDAVEAELRLPAAPIRRAGRWLATSLLAAFTVLFASAVVPAWMERRSDDHAEPNGVSRPPVNKAELVSVRVSIEPPEYTGREARIVDGLDLVAEEGASVRWEIEIDGDVDSAALVFDDSERLELGRENGEEFRVERAADESHLYRLELVVPSGEVTRGRYSRFEVRPDEAPVVEIRRPAPFVELGRERGQRLEIVVEAEDDYGMGSAALVATVASGFGELVEFRERRLEFDRRVSLGEGKTRYVSEVDLDELGMQPGVELFVFAEGEDRRRPEPNVGRSATHIARMPGDGTQSVGLSARLPVLRVPEFFRSQRQIILDTERLLADEPAITREEFVRRAEGLGFDQRALRMRYGGLLGEEFESGRPAGEDGEAQEHLDEIRRFDEMERAASGNEDVEEVLEGLPQGLAHQHDSAEINTYFDSQIKAQLKAALEEMWGAEGRLRSLEPRQALPFEYRALTLLKLVQQRSRLYVQKIGFEAPVLYPDEKRLTGELDEILTVRSSGEAAEASSLAAVRLALEGLDEPEVVARPDLLPAAREAARLLAERARRDPDLDLAGLESLRRWITRLERGEVVAEETSVKARVALWQLLPEPERSPELAVGGLTELGARYRRRLSEDSLP